MSTRSITLYTDGSCHTQTKVGGWAAIVLIEAEEVVLKAIVLATTHQRMELTAVIKAIEYLQGSGINFDELLVFSDSQYVVELPSRRAQLTRQDFKTKTGKPIRNADLVQTFFQYLDQLPIHLTKVKAHQKKSEQVNYNRKVDQLVRKMVRAYDSSQH